MDRTHQCIGIDSASFWVQLKVRIEWFNINQTKRFLRNRQNIAGLGIVNFFGGGGLRFATRLSTHSKSNLPPLRIENHKVRTNGTAKSSKSLFRYFVLQRHKRGGANALYRVRISDFC